MTTVAIMQPYFMPYAGYFRLFAAADVFVVYDCVQFPRRGWVHRNRFALEQGDTAWLTLPIEKCPRDARIDQLIFAADAAARLAAELRRFPVLQAAARARSPLLELVTNLQGGSVADYLWGQLQVLTTLLDVSRPMIRSSSLNLPGDVHGQDRIIQIARGLGATRYINAPGGRELYDESVFAEHGIELCFLQPYAGPSDSILSRLLSEPSARVARSIADQTSFG